MKEKKGFAIASLVVGILSMTLGVAAGTVLGLLGLVFGIISCVRNEKKRGVAIGGIVTSGLGMILGTVILAMIIFIYGHSEELGNSMEYALDELENSYEDNVDVFSGKAYKLEDDSAIYFEEDGTFYWYKSDSDHEDNYYQGNYECYKGIAATDYIVNELPEYSLTEDELDDYFWRNAGSELYKEKNFVCLRLHAEYAVIDGEPMEDNTGTRNYMGFCGDGYYDAANMDSAEYVMFEEIEGEQ